MVAGVVTDVAGGVSGVVVVAGSNGANTAAIASKAGFGFVKLDVAMLAEGLPHPGGHIPARDVCRFLADHGFGLIVEGIDSEGTLARVFGFGVLLGQGTLFGGRRPVKADVVAGSGQAAA